jgi:adenylate cyclase
VIANHWEQAGEPLEAARWNARAGAWAGQNHPADALRHWRAARSLVGKLSDSPDRDGLRLAACLWILQFGGWRMGMPEHEIAEVYADGRAAAEQLGQPVMVGVMIVSYGITRGMLGHVEEAIALDEEVVPVAEESGDPELRALTLGGAYWLGLAGRLAEALSRVEEMLEASRGDPNLGRATLGFSVHVFATEWRAMLLGDMGRLDEARAALGEAARLARAYDDVELLGLALGTHAWLARLSGNAGDSLARARDALEIAERSGSSFSRVFAFLGLALAYNARAEWEDAGISATRAFEVMRAAHTGLQVEPMILTVLAEATIGSGDFAAGADTAQQAFDSARRRHTKVFEIDASVALARGLRRNEGLASRGRATELLANATRLAGECGARGHLAQVHAELAELARLDGDDEGYERELREAQGLFEQTGGTGHAARIAAQLAALPA